MSLLVNLPTELSLSILTEWVQIRDLASLDIAFCSHPYRSSSTTKQKNNHVSRQDYLQILQNPNFILSEFIYCSKESLGNKYLKWLAKRGIKTNKLPFMITSLPEIITHDYLNLTKVKEISFIRIPTTNKSKSTSSNTTNQLTEITSNLVNQVWSLISLPTNNLQSNNNNQTTNNEAVEERKKTEKLLEDNHLLYLAKELPKTLQIISFQYWNIINNNQLTLLLSKSNILLHTINLSKCYNITDDAIVLICQQYSNTLQNLNISCCLNITGIFFSVIYSLCKCLNSLNISYCHNLQYTLLHLFITRYTLLKEFIAEDLSILNNELIIELVKTNYNSIDFINIDYCNNININCLNEVLLIKPFLQYFISKDCCYQYDSFKSKENKSDHHHKMILSQKLQQYKNPPIIHRELILKGCYTRHTALNQLLTNFPNTTNSTGSNTAEEVTNTTTNINIIEIPGLQSINASECRKFSDISIQTITNRFHNSLISLKLSPWKDITMTSFISLFQQCSLLQIIHLSYCESLTDIILEQISFNNMQLKELYLNYCPLITDKGMKTIITSCKELRILECENCLYLTNTLIKDIFQYSKHLQRLNMIATGINSQCFHSMITQYNEQLDNSDKIAERDNKSSYWDRNENSNNFILLVSEYWRDRQYWKYYQDSNEFQKKILKKVQFIPTQMSHNNHHPH